MKEALRFEKEYQYDNGDAYRVWVFEEDRAEIAIDREGMGARHVVTGDKLVQDEAKRLQHTPLHAPSCAVRVLLIRGNRQQAIERLRARRLAHVGSVCHEMKRTTT